MRIIANAEDKRKCNYCNDEIRGRSDKRFCNDYCRNAFNNLKRAGEPYRNLVRNINNILLKNRRILDSILKTGSTARITREDLLIKGFNFNYHTNTYKTGKGNSYHYCYDRGYLAMGNEWYLVVKAK